MIPSLVKGLTATNKSSGEKGKNKRKEQLSAVGGQWSAVIKHGNIMNLRRKKLYFFSIFILFIVVMAFIVYRYNASRPKVITEKVVLSPRKSRVQIRGFEFNGYNEGKKVLSIKADRFTVEKKKIGFLTTSLFNVANLNNSVIDIYGQGDESGKDVVTGLKEQISGVTFKDTFSKDALLAFPGKSIASITMQPVSMSLYIGESLITRISASSASVRMKQRDIVFQGGVEVSSDKKTLTTDRLIFFPEKALINTNSHFVLKTIDGQSEGEQLSADIFLMPIDGGDEAKEN